MEITKAITTNQDATDNVIISRTQLNTVINESLVEAFKFRDEEINKEWIKKVEEFKIEFDKLDEIHSKTISEKERIINILEEQKVTSNTIINNLKAELYIEKSKSWLKKLFE